MTSIDTSRFLRFTAVLIAGLAAAGTAGAAPVSFTVTGTIDVLRLERAGDPLPGLFGDALQVGATAALVYTFEPAEPRPPNDGTRADYSQVLRTMMLRIGGVEAVFDYGNLSASCNDSAVTLLQNFTGSGQGYWTQYAVSTCAPLAGHDDALTIRYQLFSSTVVPNTLLDSVALTATPPEAGRFMTRFGSVNAPVAGPPSIEFTVNRVAVTPVPEPATGLLALVSAAGLGWACRRRWMRPGNLRSI